MPMSSSTPAGTRASGSSLEPGGPAQVSAVFARRIRGPCRRVRLNPTGVPRDRPGHRPHQRRHRRPRTRYPPHVEEQADVSQGSQRWRLAGRDRRGGRVHRWVTARRVSVVVVQPEHTKDVVAPGAPMGARPLFITHANAPCDTASRACTRQRWQRVDGHGGGGCAPWRGAQLAVLPGRRTAARRWCRSHDGVMTGKAMRARRPLEGSSRSLPVPSRPRFGRAQPRTTSARPT